MKILQVFHKKFCEFPPGQPKWAKKMSDNEIWAYQIKLKLSLIVYLIFTTVRWKIPESRENNFESRLFFSSGLASWPRPDLHGGPHQNSHHIRFAQNLKQIQKDD